MSPHNAWNGQRPPIVISDHDGIAVPFSKGTLASSILAGGMDTESAYKIASQVESRLRSAAVRQISHDDLHVLTVEIIESHAGQRYAEAYAAWRQIEKARQPVFVILSGAPGVGKSTLATRLAVRLGITRVVTTDTIREILRTVIAETVLPELHLSTYESVDSDLTKHGWEMTYQRQALAVGEATIAVVKRLVSERRSAVIEGVHLIPGLLKRRLAPHANEAIFSEFLLTLGDQNLHYGNLFERHGREPGRGGNRHLQYFDNIRAIQALLQEKADRTKVASHDLADVQDLTPYVVNDILTQWREGRKGAA